MTVKELSVKLTREELVGWIAFYEIKNEEEKKAMERLKINHGQEFQKRGKLR